MYRPTLNEVEDLADQGVTQGQLSRRLPRNPLDAGQNLDHTSSATDTPKKASVNVELSRQPREKASVQRIRARSARQIPK